MQTDNQTAPPRQRDFSRYWLIGIGWGILAAIATIVVSLFALSLGAGSGGTSWAATFPMLLIVGVPYGTMVAILFAIVPIGPVAALLGWPLYRLRVTNAWAYACAGALSALSAPSLVVAMDVILDPTHSPLADASDLLPLFLSPSSDFPLSTLVLFAWFALVGAFAGFMAARALRRDLSA